MKKKRAITLIEIMIVILLIGIIGGALAFNMRGSMDQGKAFKTEQNILRVQDLLLLECAQSGVEPSALVGKWEEVVAQSALVRDPRELCKDGWNQKLKVEVVNGEFKVSSAKFKTFKEKHQKKI